MKSEYIEREAVNQIIAAQCGECADFCLEFDGILPDCNQCLLYGAKKAVESVPAADVRPVVRNEKKILDVTCGDRTIWFQKDEPHTIYCDKRREEWEGDFGKALRADGKQKHRHLVINPDVMCDFTDLPFDNCTFSLVVFDPPHIENLAQSSWLRKSYGSLDGDWKPMIRKGFEECMRVLKPDGVLVFKWSDISISTREILNVIGQEPLFGHRSGKKMNTHWMCFMKFAEDRNVPTKCENEWIPISERLPDAGERVLCYCRANIYEVMKMRTDGAWVHNDQVYDSTYMSGFVTHWMPLPQPPKEET